MIELSRRIGRSVGWLSQIERGLGQPTNDDVQAIGQHLGVPVSLFFDNQPGPDIERGYIVRKENRRELSVMPGLREELLSPDLTDSFEVILATHEPGAALDTPTIRDTQEVVYLTTGRLNISIAGRPFHISAGDSFRLRGEAFVWSNPYPSVATSLWVVSPPIY